MPFESQDLLYRFYVGHSRVGLKVSVGGYVYLPYTPSGLPNSEVNRHNEQSPVLEKNAFVDNDVLI